MHDKAGTSGGTGIRRVDRHASECQTAREFFGEQRGRQFRLSIKCARIIETPAIEIIEHDSLRRRPLDAGIAAYDHDPARPAPNGIGKAIHEREMRDVIDEKLRFDTVKCLQGGRVRHSGIRDDGIQRAAQAAYGIRRCVDRFEVRQVAADGHRRRTRRFARRASAVERSCEADNLRTIGNEGLHRFETDAGIAARGDDSLSGEIDAGQHLIGLRAGTVWNWPSRVQTPLDRSTAANRGPERDCGHANAPHCSANGRFTACALQCVRIETKPSNVDIRL
ncbi:MAG: hypothetical protein JWN43_2904 [Gammaproteobacteria bacterium]|nr:hypothetical protein [Gammaproteobacteria bacterium]